MFSGKLLCWQLCTRPKAQHPQPSFVTPRCHEPQTAAVVTRAYRNKPWLYTDTTVHHPQLHNLHRLGTRHWPGWTHRRACAAQLNTQTPQPVPTSAQSCEPDAMHSVRQQHRLQAFDKGHCSPQLLHLIDSGDLPVQGKKAFVPGCGRGYDVFAFAAAGASVAVGLDICPIAVQATQAEQQLVIGDNPDACAASKLIAGDFFSHDSSPDFKGPYDIGYDYTFLCALHPEMRVDWAKAWSRLLAPGGQLLTMVYPVDPSLGEGPPWPVTPELYKQLLPPAGFELVSLEPIPHTLSHESRRGREWLGRWINKGSN